MEVLRLIDDGPRDPYYNMAADETMAISVGGRRSPPTLRLYGWNPNAVSIGFFQEVEEEVDLDFCAARGVRIVRRITGGGAVFHGSGELTYSLAVPIDNDAIPQDVQASYGVICRPIVATLRALGADAKFRPVNDIEVGGRKLSGNAQTRRFGAVLQHGTILVSLDRSLLPALKVKLAKLEGKGFVEPGERVTTLNEVLGREVGIPSLALGVAEAFGKQFGLRLRRGSLLQEEASRIPSLAEKYSSEEWLRRR